jgi:hypothetical protein
MSEEENIKPPQVTGDPQGPEGGQQPEEIIPAEATALPNEDTVATELPTTNIKLQTEEEMEVHHHAHDPAAPHHKKNWKSYFWEFLMLFLAVFCGFFAEYQLELTVERHREKEYATLLIQDLENDTINTNTTIKQVQKVSASIDSISSFVFKGVSGNKVSGSFYYHSQIGAFSPLMIWNDATLIQLTQSGNLRYFRNHKLVNKLSAYYSMQSYVRSLNTGDRERRDITLAIRSRILNNHYYKYYSKVTPTDPLPIPDSLMINMIPLQSSNAQLLNEYANSFENRRGIINLILTKTYPNAISDARELIFLLKKEFDLK